MMIKKVSVDTDWKALAEVFNHFVDISTAAYPSKPVEEGFFEKKWNEHPDFPFYEVSSESEIIGFGYLSPFHPADSMKGTAALTYFILPGYTGKGIGKQLLELLLSEGSALGINNFLASISSDNLGSIKFHARNGFRECGRFESVGNKNGRIFDMVWMQRIISPTGKT